MHALGVHELSVPPSYLLGDDTLRIPASPAQPIAGCLSDDGTTLSLDLGWGIVVIEIDAWRQTATHRFDAPFKEISGIPSRLCTFRAPDEEQLWLFAPGGTCTRLRIPAKATDGMRVMLSPTRPEELYLWGLRSLTRWRCEAGALHLEASLSCSDRHDFGYEIREVTPGEDGATLYLRTDRDVLAVDAISLEPRGVLLDINEHLKNPRAWVDELQSAALSAGQDQLYLLLMPPKQNKQCPRLIECSLRGGVKRELLFPKDLLLHSMSPLLPGDRLLLGSSFHGTTLVDTRAMKIVESAREVGGRFDWVDRARSRAYGFDLEQNFHAIDASKKLTATIRESKIKRYHFEWNETHLVALSRQRGVELFSPPTPLPRVLPPPGQVSQFRLNVQGRWALFLYESVLTIQDTSSGQTRKVQGLFRENGSVSDATITGDGVLWWWNKRELCSERGVKLLLAKRETWGRLDGSPSGKRLLLLTAKEIHLFDTDSGARLGTIPAPKQAHGVFANDQVLVVAGSDGLRWYDAQSGALQQWRKRRISNPAHLAVSPDGALVVLLERTSIELISRDDPSKSSPSVVGQGIHGLAFSPDGAMLAVSCDESQIRVFTLSALQGASSGKSRKKSATKARK